MPEWGHLLSAWANSHKDQLVLWSTIFSGIGALVSAFAALVVMLLTRTLARDNAILRKAGTEPEVVAYLLPDERHINIMNLVIANVGNGPARNVVIEFVGEVQSLKQRGARPLRKTFLPILPWLPQDERFVQIFGNALDLMVEPPPADFDIKTHYEDSGGNKRTTLSHITLENFAGLSRLHSSEHETAEALKSLAKTVEGWTSSRRLQVETITVAEKAEQDRRRYEAIIEKSRQIKA